MQSARIHVAFLVLLPLLGCNKIKEKLEEKAAEKITETAIEKSTGAKVDLGSSSGEITVKDPKTGEVARLGGALPADWPSSLPVYPGGKIVGSISTPEAKQVTFTTHEGVDKVNAFYKAKLPGKPETTVDVGDSKMLSTKDGNTTYLAIVSRSGEETTVQLQRQDGK